MIAKTTSFLIAAVSALMAFAPAHAIVPGSDTYERAHDGVAVRSVTEGPVGVTRRTVQESRSYGFQKAGGQGFPAPGSEHADDAADAAALRSVSDGTGRTALGIGREPADRPGVLVPGSDRF